MKNLNVFGVHWKIRDLRKGGSWKTNVEGGDCWKRGRLGQFANLRGGLARNWKVIFLRGRGWYHNTHSAHNLEKERRCANGAWGFKDILWVHPTGLSGNFWILTFTLRLKCLKISEMQAWKVTFIQTSQLAVQDTVANVCDYSLRN